ncbi:MAG: hypothetical protein ACTSUF_00945 [Candidatus Heimdallarchaeaceae archaeon]
MSKRKHEVMIFVRFPKCEFKKAPKRFIENLSLKYKDDSEFFYIGIITTLITKKDGTMRISLEVRKDETPMWYLKEIIDAASRKEVVLMKGERCLLKNGAITSVVLPKKINCNQIVDTFFAVLYS